jgi:hypothetical protein
MVGGVGQQGYNIMLVGAQQLVMLVSGHTEHERQHAQLNKTG